MYHWWPNRESSRTAHSHDEWLQNRMAIDREIDALPLLLPAGESRWIRAQLERLVELEGAVRVRQRRIRALQRRIEEQREQMDQLKRALATERKKNRTGLGAFPRRVARKVRRTLKARTGRG